MVIFVVFLIWKFYVQTVPRKDTQGYRIYGARFLDEVKKLGTREAFAKSRFIIQAY